MHAQRRMKKGLPPLAYHRVRDAPKVLGITLLIYARYSGSLHAVREPPLSNSTLSMPINSPSTEINKHKLVLMDMDTIMGKHTKWAACTELRRHLRTTSQNMSPHTRDRTRSTLTSTTTHPVDLLHLRQRRLVQLRLSRLELYDERALRW